MHLLVISSNAESVIRFRGDFLRLAKAEGDVTLITSGDSPELESFCNANDIAVEFFQLERVGLSFLKDLNYCLKLRSAIRRIKPDLIFSYTLKPNLHGSILGKIEKVPCITMFTGLGQSFIERQKSSGIRRLGRIATKLASKWASHVVFHNPHDRTLFCKLGWAKPSASTWVHGSGVDLKVYPPHRRLFNGTLTVGMLSRLREDKGVLYFCGAATELAGNPKIQFKLAGPPAVGENAVPLEFLERLEEEANFEYVGSLQSEAEVNRFLQGIDCFVLPSLREGTPRSTLEAMSTGLPVIMFAVPGCKHLIKGNGRSVKKIDVRSLAAAILDLSHSSEADMNQMAEASLALVQDFCSIKVAEHMVKICHAQVATTN